MQAAHTPHAHLQPPPVQEERMQKALQVLADGVNTLRTGRANPAILDRIMVREAGLEG